MINKSLTMSIQQQLPNLSYAWQQLLKVTCTPSNMVASIPIKLASAMEQARRVALCPIVTLLPMIVSADNPLMPEVAEQTTVPSCKLLLLPMLILPSSPVISADFNAMHLIKRESNVKAIAVTTLAFEDASIPHRSLVSKRYIADDCCTGSYKHVLGQPRPLHAQVHYGSVSVDCSEDQVRYAKSTVPRQVQAVQAYILR